MSEFCLNHPSRKALSFCHNCGAYYCADCLSEGKGYYYCNKKECYVEYLKENPIKNVKNYSNYFFCLSCGEKIISDAKFCPNCGNAFKKNIEEENQNISYEKTLPNESTSVFQPKPVINIKQIFGLILIAIIIFTLIKTCSNKNDSDDSESMALVMSRDFVRDKLLSPSTAEFAGLSDSKVFKKENVWYVYSYVDAKNALGVPIRKNYACRLMYKPDENVWSLLDMNIE